MKLSNWEEKRAKVKTTSFTKMLTKLPKIIKLAVQTAWNVNPKITIITLINAILTAALTMTGLLAVNNALTYVFTTGATKEKLIEAAPAVIIAMLAAGTIAIINAVNSVIKSNLSEKIEYEIKYKILKTAGTVDLETYENAEFHDQLTRNVNHGGRNAAGIVTETFNLTGKILVTGGTVTILISLHVAILAALMLATIPLVLSAIISAKKWYQHNYTLTRLWRTEMTLENILTNRTDAAEIRSFNMNTWILNKWTKTKTELLKHENKTRQTDTQTKLLFQFLAGVGTGIIYITIIGLLWTNNLEWAAAGTTLIAVKLIRTNINSIVESITQLYEKGLYITDYLAFTEKETQKENERNNEPAEPLKIIKLENITYQYPNENQKAVNNVNLTIKKGNTIAIVGENGSGKTTLSKIIAGLYTPTTGTIRWNNQNYQQHQKMIRRRISTVFQTYGRWPFNMKENLTLGVDENNENLNKLIEKVDLEETIKELDHGIETLLTKELDNGTDLSGGQWQKVALGRALWKNADILIMDEPSANLDPIAEKHIFEMAMKTNETIVLITHRLASVINADQIIVMEHGKIIETGTHAELLTKNKKYSEMFNAQADAYINGY